MKWLDCRNSRIISLIFMAGFISMCHLAYGDVLWYHTMEQLVKQSDRILAGKVIEKESYWSSINELIYTTVTLEPSFNIKGTEAPKIEFTILGGIVGNTGLSVSEIPEFEIGEDIIIFLKHGEGKYQGDIIGSYVLVSSTIGTVRLGKGLTRKEIITISEPIEYRINQITKGEIHQEDKIPLRKGISLSGNNHRISVSSKILTPPNITSVSGTPGTDWDHEDTEITINGTNLISDDATKDYIVFTRAIETAPLGWLMRRSTYGDHITSWTSTQIKCGIRPGTGSGPIKVRVNNIDSNISDDELDIKFISHAERWTNARMGSSDSLKMIVNVLSADPYM